MSAINSKGELNKTELTRILEELVEVNIVFRQGEKNENDEYGYAMNPEFEDTIKYHFDTQNQIERMDKERGTDSTLDYGGLNRDYYILGISLNDFLGKKMEECDECENLVLKKRHDSDGKDEFIEHIKIKHPEHFIQSQIIQKNLENWSIVITLMRSAEQKLNKEWRSK